MRKAAILGTAAVLAVAGTGCRLLGRQSFAEPVVTFKDVRVKGVGLTGGSFDILLNVYNPNGYRLDATKLTYKLFVDSIPFGSGATDQNFTVNQKDSTAVTLPLDFNWSGVGEVGRQLINKGTVNYRVTGDVTVMSPVGNYTIPYDRTGRFSTLSGTR